MRRQETDLISGKSVVMDRLEKRLAITFALTMAVFMIFASAASAELVYINDTSISPGGSITVPILIDVTDPAGLGAATITLNYNPSVVEVTAVSDWVFDNASSNIQNSSGYTRIVAYQESINGVGPGTIQLANVTLQSVGSLGESSALDLDVTTLKNNSGQLVSYTVSNGIFVTTEAKGDLNNNGYVDIGDVAKVAFMVAGKVPEELSADFNDNGYVDIGDAARIAFYLAGKVGEL